MLGHVQVSDCSPAVVSGRLCFRVFCSNVQYTTLRYVGTSHGREQVPLADGGLVAELVLLRGQFYRNNTASFLELKII
jgi:hypothetical protein